VLGEGFALEVGDSEHTGKRL